MAKPSHLRVVKPYEVVREKERLQITGVPRTSWYRLEKTRNVPRKIRLGKHAVGWVRDELEAWIHARMLERDNAEKN